MTPNKIRHARGETIHMETDMEVRVNKSRPCNWCGRTYTPTKRYHRFCAGVCRQAQWKASIEYQVATVANCKRMREEREAQRKLEGRKRGQHKRRGPTWNANREKRTAELIEIQKPYRAIDLSPPTMQFLPPDRFARAVNHFLQKEIEP